MRTEHSAWQSGCRNSVCENEVITLIRLGRNEEQKFILFKEDTNMPYGKVKVYSDGGHYIGIPYEPNPYAKKRRKAPEEVIAVKGQAEGSATALAENADGNNTIHAERAKTDAIPEERRMTRKELFEELYLKSADMEANERQEFIRKEMTPYFGSKEQCAEFVAQNLERKHRNMVCRKVRLWRKINQQQFNFFVTFTFDDKLHDEESFRKTLSRCLQHFSSRKGWRYIGVWERAPDTRRLHFHGIFCIPEGTLLGRNEEVRDFDTRARKMRTTYQNDFFGKKFGRNDFKPIDHSSEVPQAIRYLTKYLEKTGEKLVYSRGLYRYFVTDVMDEDIICPYGENEKKFILSDKFSCWEDGEYLGTVSPEVIARLPKVT